MSKEKQTVNVFKDKNTGEWIKELDSTKERIELDENDKVITGMLDDLENLPYLFGLPDVAMCLWAASYRKQSEGEWLKHYRSGVTVSEGYVSSCCDMWNNRNSHFCPDCGAKMKGGEE